MFIIEGLVWGIFGILLIYFIVQRIRDKKKETFEDRDS